MNYLLYDGECPFCTEFSRFYEIKQALDPMEIVSMRDAEKLRPLNLPKKLDFNLGMILVLEDGRILQGEEAFRLINGKVRKKSLIDHVLVGVSSKKWISSLVYPLFFRARKLVLRQKGVTDRLERVDLSST